MLMSYEESLKILHSHIKTYEKIEKIALTECLGRILAQDIKAPKNQPEFPTSAMDGYAIKFEDQDKPLKILGLTPAGTMPEFKVENNTCVKTFTGSLMSVWKYDVINKERIYAKERSTKLCGAGLLKG